MSDKNYLDEIDEFLKKTKKDKLRPRRKGLPRFSLNLPHLYLVSFFKTAMPTPGRLMAGGVLLLVLAMILRPFARSAMVPLIWAGLGLFVVAYFLYLLSDKKEPRYEKRWRGELIEDKRPSIWERVGRWFRRR
jgi:hypothetical protein